MGRFWTIAILALSLVSSVKAQPATVSELGWNSKRSRIVITCNTNNEVTNYVYIVVVASAGTASFNATYTNEFNFYTNNNAPDFLATDGTLKNVHCNGEGQRWLVLLGADGYQSALGQSRYAPTNNMLCNAFGGGASGTALFSFTNTITTNIVINCTTNTVY